MTLFSFQMSHKHSSIFEVLLLISTLTIKIDFVSCNAIHSHQTDVQALPTPEKLVARPPSSQDIQVQEIGQSTLDLTSMNDWKGLTVSVRSK